MLHALGSVNQCNGCFVTCARCGAAGRRPPARDCVTPERLRGGSADPARPNPPRSCGPQSTATRRHSGLIFCRCSTCGRPWCAARGRNKTGLARGSRSSAPCISVSSFQRHDRESAQGCHWECGCFGGAHGAWGSIRAAPRCHAGAPQDTRPMQAHRLLRQQPDHTTTRLVCAVSLPSRGCSHPPAGRRVTATIPIPSLRSGSGGQLRLPSTIALAERMTSGPGPEAPSSTPTRSQRALVQQPKAPQHEQPTSWQHLVGAAGRGSTHDESWRGGRLLETLVDASAGSCLPQLRDDYLHAHGCSRAHTAAWPAQMPLPAPPPPPPPCARATGVPSCAFRWRLQQPAWSSATLTEATSPPPSCPCLESSNGTRCAGLLWGHARRTRWGGAGGGLLLCSPV
jgi:hypothetical protein